MPSRGPTASSVSRLARFRAREFSIQGEFQHGYRNKEDISALPANTLVVGSQNVLTNSAEQIVIRNGYQLDGDAGNQNTYGIDSSFDFDSHIDGIRNLRKWGTTLDVRYVNPVTNAVSWVSMITNLSATNVANFCSFWETVTLKNVCLFVNGNKNIWRWSGGVGSFASATSTTITLSGSKTLPTLNFDQVGTVLIDGAQYTYTSAGVTTSQPYTQTPTTTTVDIDLTHWVAQSFTAGVAANQITTVTLKLKVVNTTSTFNNLPVVYGYIYTNNAGVPGTLVAGANASASSSVSGDYTLTFTFNQTVTAGTIYHMVFNTPYPTDSANWVFSTYIGASGSVGTNTSTTTSFQSPSSWTPSNGYLNMTVNENDLGGLTFSGVLPDPTLATINVGDAVIQSPQVAATSVISAPLSTFDLISNFGNQIYYGSFASQTVYITKINSFTDATVSVPRVVGEGANVTLDAIPTGFAAQDDSMLVTAGKDYWYQSKFTLSADLAKESFTFGRLKTTGNQAAQSQALIGKMKNNVIFVSYEPIFNTLGTVQNFLNSPQAVNYSDSIKYDMDAYDFTGGSVYYFNYFLYFTVPMMGIVRMYNVQKKYWEAPQVMPISFFYQVDNVLYGHSSLTNESYQLFVPTIFNDNNNPISAIAAFPYVSSLGGSAPEKKNFNKHYTEGYIAGNTNLTLTINYDFGGFSGNYADIISGADSRIIFNKVTDGSLGQNPLGSQPIGSILNITPQPVIPKFRKISTFPRKNVFEYQLVFSSNDVDQNWALLRFGPAVGSANDIPVEITE